jgi:hypothetical protein
MESALKSPRKDEHIVACSHRRWQAFRLSRRKSRMHSIDWTLFSSAHNDPMASDVIAPSPWSIFGCKNGNDKIFSLSSDEISTKIHFYMHLGLRLFTEANDGGSRGKVFLILCNVLCVRADGLLNSQYLACLLSIGMIIRL